MRVAAHSIHGLGAVAMLVPPDPGVSIERAQRACAIAKGTWSTEGNGCMVPDVPSPPTWCDYVPFSTALFNECALPTADQLALAGSYTAYKIAQKDTAACQPTYVNGQLVPAAADCTTTGEQAAQEVMSTGAAQGTDLVTQAGPEYTAALEHPWLSSIVGPAITNDLAHPFSSNGWMIYAGLAVGGLLIANLLFGGRRL
jgi:hypothetical protein